MQTKTTPQLQQKVMPWWQRKARAKSVLITTLSINIDEQLGTKKINISSTEKTSNIKWLNSWVHPPPHSYVEWKCHFIFDWHPNLTFCFLHTSSISLFQSQTHTPSYACLRHIWNLDLRNRFLKGILITPMEQKYWISFCPILVRICTCKSIHT